MKLSQPISNFFKQYEEIIKQKVNKLTFVKLCNNWYVDLPQYDGKLSELEMVAGADDLLQEIANKSDKTHQVTIEIVEDNRDSDIQLYLVDLDNAGGTYKVYSSNQDFETKNLWLCNVTKFVFGEHPDEIFVKILW